MGIRDGQLEVSGKKSPPGALKMAAMVRLHGKGYAAGRQHALSRAGLHGGTASKMGPLESIVKAVKKPAKDYSMDNETVPSNSVNDPNLRPPGKYTCPEGCAVENLRGRSRPTIRSALRRSTS